MSSELQQLYQQLVLDHARARHGCAPLTGDPGTPGTGYGTSHQINPTCGDEIRVETELDPATGHIGLRWQGEGCSISMASASVLSELLADVDEQQFLQVEGAFHTLMHSRGRGEPDEELLGDAVAFAGVSKFPARIKCALLSWMAVKDALVQARAAVSATAGEENP